MGSRHNSANSSTTQPPPQPQKLRSTTSLIDTLSGQLDYLHVSTQSPHNVLNTKNHEFENLDSTKRSWSGNSNNRHSSPPIKSPQPLPIIPSSASATTSSSSQPVQAPQPLLQLMSQTSSQPMSPSGGALMSPEIYYMNQAAFYTTAGQPYGYSNPGTRTPNPYQYPQYPATYVPPSGPYQWPMTNFNFIPNLFVMAGAGPSSHSNYQIQPSMQPVPLMKQSFRQDFNRRYGGRVHSQSESGRGSGSRGNGNAQSRRQGSKTALCRNISEFNECSYGERCYFAHSADELKPKPANAKYKTVNCTAFTEKGHCPYGDKCHFIHQTHGDEERPPTDPLRR